MRGRSHSEHVGMCRVTVGCDSQGGKKRLWGTKYTHPTYTQGTQSVSQSPGPLEILTEKECVRKSGKTTRESLSWRSKADGVWPWSSPNCPVRSSKTCCYQGSRSQPTATPLPRPCLPASSPCRRPTKIMSATGDVDRWPGSTKRRLWDQAACPGSHENGGTRAMPPLMLTPAPTSATAG